MKAVKSFLRITIASACAACFSLPAAAEQFYNPPPQAPAPNINDYAPPPGPYGAPQGYAPRGQGYAPGPSYGGPPPGYGSGYGPGPGPGYGYGPGPGYGPGYGNGPRFSGPWNNGRSNRMPFVGNRDNWGKPRNPFRHRNMRDYMTMDKDRWSENWDDMLNAPSRAGTMPGGWEAPSVSVPNPIDVGDELQDAARDVPSQMRDMNDNMDFNYYR